MSEPLISNERIMSRALELARRGEGRTRPNPPVGAVIVHDGQVIGEGFHRRAGQPHAEILALQQAGERAAGADLYVTLEPCCHYGRTGPCAEAVVAAGISRVFIGTLDPNPLVGGKGVARLQAVGIQVETGILERECRRLIAPFAKHVTTGLPLVILKSAVTLDGKTATSTGQSQWISNPSSREYVHRVRDRIDAVMVGIGTVIKDNPRLTTRLPGGGRDADRVVVDARLELPEDAALLTAASPAAAIIATTRLAPTSKIARLKARGVQVLQLDEIDGRVNLCALMRELGGRGIQSILLEGGAGLNASALEAGIIDRLMIFMAPMIFGGSDGKGIFSGQGVKSLEEGHRVSDIRVTSFDDDILIEGEVQRCLPD
jgi:diaminohydroxyphosphoribosylaminopyrimidine deaminase/5-amino-6-(5-phosphoribosylamino)uracil reductase